MTNTTIKTKIVSLIIALAMIVSLFPMTIFAEGSATITLSHDTIEVPYAKQEKVEEYIKNNVTVSYSEGGVVPTENITVTAADGVATVSVEGYEPVSITYTVGEPVRIGFLFTEIIPIEATTEEINITLVRDHVNAAVRYEYDNEDGYIEKPLADSEISIYEIDAEQKIVWIEYGVYVASIEYTEAVRPVLTVDEPLTITVAGFGGGKITYVNFTPEESGSYVFTSSSETDPRADLYNFDGELINSSDDKIGYNFYMESQLEAGKKYYLKLNDYRRDSEATITVKKVCDEHTPGEQNCLGYVCTVCDTYYGETSDHTPGEHTCHGYKCTVCYDYFGEEADHDMSGEHTCAGYFCRWCNQYFGEAGDVHVEDENNNGFCDYCNDFIPNVGGSVTENSASTNTIPDNEDGILYLTFVPTLSGKYCFESESDSDPALYVYDADGNEIGYSDDVFGYNFYLELSLEKDKTYYIGLYNYDGESQCTLIVNKICDEHTPGEQNCLGYLCTVCGQRFGEAGDHTFSEMKYEDTYHYGYCDICEGYESKDHEFDAEGKCVCGYFVHEHVFDSYNYDPIEHWGVCSLCGVGNSEYFAHEYDENGVCICGREPIKGIYLGAQLLLDGQYLDNDGNVSDTLPEGGYAYYKDGKLTINNFELAGSNENDVDIYNALYSESDLTILLVGSNNLYTEYDDGIYVVGANLTIEGEGILRVYGGDGCDGIDVNGGKLTVNGGTLFVKGTDHGIEVYGDTEINGGIFYIEADDDGMDLDDTVINGGIFYIHAEDNGIDASYFLTINGGHFYITTNDDNGIEANDGLTINDGVFDINANDECIYSYDVLTINGGFFKLNAGEDNAAIVGEYEIVFGEDMGELEVVYYDYYYGYVLALDGEMISDITVNSSEYEEKELITEDSVHVNSYVILSDVEATLGLRVYNENGDLLEKDVDYTISWLIKPEAVGEARLLVTGMGDYVGSVIKNVKMIAPEKINEGETVKTDLYSLVINHPTGFEFTPELSATYIISYKSSANSVVLICNSKMVAIGVASTDENGVFCLEQPLEAGETYYLILLGYFVSEEIFECEIRLDMICPGHVGGEATYTEQATCDLCGEHYGDVLECPGHFGGEATYQESAICEECGFHYGDKLYCDHMCHKGGIYAIIWSIFDEIYDYFGIETECKCGEMH